MISARLSGTSNETFLGGEDDCGTRVNGIEVVVVGTVMVEFNVFSAEEFDKPVFCTNSIAGDLIGGQTGVAGMRA